MFKQKWVTQSRYETIHEPLTKHAILYEAVKCSRDWHLVHPIGISDTK